MSLSRETLMHELSTRLGLDLSEVDDNTELFSTGLLDSFSMVELIMIVESECGVSVNPLDVSLENFDSVKRILDFSARLTA